MVQISRRPCIVPVTTTCDRFTYLAEEIAPAQILRVLRGSQWYARRARVMLHPRSMATAVVRMLA
jgi:hypothetical protein